MKRILLILTLALVALAGCKKDPAPEAVKVSQIKLVGMPTTDFTVGRSVTISAVITPDDATDKSVTFTSSNPEVATVEYTKSENNYSLALLKAVGPGKATITATANDGSGVKDEAEVTVIDGEGESTYQSITLTTKKAVGEEFQFSIEIDGLGDLSADERMAILQAAVVDMNITDVAGHSDFYDVKGTLKKSNLKIEIAGSIGRFTCDKMGLTSLDVSHCPELYNIYCPGNDLTELDISKNTKLVRLVLGTNILSSLDVSNATELQYLDCRYNSIETLDVSKNLNLERLDCYDNKLTSLDVSKNTKLDRVDCSSNQLESLLICSSVAYGYEILTCYKNKLDEAAMTALIEALPTAQQSDARVLLYNNSDSNELNKLTDAHIAAAKDKGYTVRIKESDASGWETK